MIEARDSRIICFIDHKVHLDTFMVNGNSRAIDPARFSVDVMHIPD
jgi:hypothetical protein